MANLLIIRKIAEEKGITIRDIASQVGIGESALHSLIKKGSTNTKTLEDIARVLNVPVGIFFDDYKKDTPTFTSTIKGDGNSWKDVNIGIGSNYSLAHPSSKKAKIEQSTVEIESLRIEIESLKKEIEHQKNLLNEKERYIQTLESFLKK